MMARLAFFSRTACVLLVLALASLIAPVQSAEVRGQIQTNDALRDVVLLGATTRVQLVPAGSSQGNRQHSTLVRRDGSFSLQGVQPGTYLLDILSRAQAFHTYRVDVPAPAAASASSDAQGATAPGAPGLPQVRIHLPGQSLSASASAYALPYPLIAAPRAGYDFFTEKEGFNIKAMLANPMMLMAGAGMLLVFVMPKIMVSRRILTDSMSRSCPRSAHVEDDAAAVGSAVSSAFAHLLALQAARTTDAVVEYMRTRFFERCGTSSCPSVHLAGRYAT